LSEPRYLTIEALDKSGQVIHAFTTRQNGLGIRTNGIKQPDDWDSVAGMFAIDPARIVTVNQVHGDRIVTVGPDNFTNMRSTEADALITCSPGIAIGVETADCVPILLLDPATPAVAAIHAGWRSTVQGIVRKTIEKMQKEFGSDPRRLIAAIGPAIGPECYEVDEAVMAPVRGTFSFWQTISTPRSVGKWGLDLVGLDKRDLLSIGLLEENIHSLGMCTSCKRDLFYSFRAEGRTGRMLSVIMIKA
jgi:YfiH family protein